MMILKTNNTNKDVLVDNEVYLILKNESIIDGKTFVYIQTIDEITKNQVKIPISRLILFTNAPIIDHKDRSYFNNQLYNLRPADESQNSWNTKKRKTSFSGCKCSSQYKGVSKNTEKQKWVAQIRVRGKSIFLGYYLDEVNAAKAYNEAAIRYYGEFAVLNII